MNRRSFLQLATMALAAEGVKRAWPFRVYSIPREVRIASRREIEEYLGARAKAAIHEFNTRLNEVYFYQRLSGIPAYACFPDRAPYEAGYRWVPQDVSNPDDVRAAEAANAIMLRTASPAGQIFPLSPSAFLSTLSE